MNINKDDVVLEVGSGHNPNPRSDILLDLYEEDKEGHRHRTSIIKDRPFVNADICNMPFENKEIDYVIAQYILEHIPNPDKAIKELQRVAKKGIIIVPNEFHDIAHPSKTHLWFCNVYDNVLIFKRKPKTWKSPFGNVFHELFNKDQEYFWFFQHHYNLFSCTYEWYEKINFKIEEYSLPDFSKLNIEKLIAKNKRGLRELIPPQLWHKVAKDNNYPKIKKFVYNLLNSKSEIRKRKVETIVERLNLKS